MSDLKICRICLRTEAKMYRYDQYQLKYYHEEVMALKIDDTDNLPKCYCYECAAMLHKFHKFKEKCFIGDKVLKQLLWKGPISYDSIYKIDRASINLQSPISIMTVNSLVKKCVIKETNKKTVKEVNIKPIDLKYMSDNSTSVDQFAYDEVTENEKTNNSDTIISDLINNQNGCDELPTSPQTIFLDNNVGAIELKSEYINDNIKPSAYKNFLNSRHWKIITLTEEEAVNEFRSKANSKQYLAAAFRCTHCFRGFSKEDMLKRHTLLRHNQAAGSVDCHFCHMRFKYKSFLRKHLAHHYVRYRCLRCERICPFETSAMMHEEYHSGVILRCEHCSQEFRHKSTYYSHVRTHRGEHSCAQCGAAFASRRGLNNHAKIKHPCTDDDGSSDGGGDAHCQKCGIRFGSRKAFEEHLFQSAMHADGPGGKVNINCSLSKKILGKKEKTKITNEIRKRADESIPLIALNTTRTKRQKRNRRKPTTCHQLLLFQCGMRFETQAACMKHHVARHPRTSFFPPTQRYICEVCGASLAPGSVAVHRNIHSRAQIHSCAECGKQFHSAIGLRRHRVTHTGEKPFGCPLCEKRFTQNNSMKLHYRTFHLKQPYPKRNRKKHKEQPEMRAEMEVSHSEQDSDCLLEADINSLPDAPGIEPVTDTIENHMVTNEPMHYMPL